VHGEEVRSDRRWEAQLYAGECVSPATWGRALGSLVVGRAPDNEAKRLEFELAGMSTLMDDVPRIVTFDFDPLPLLRSLAEGRLQKERGQLGQFEIEITGDGLLSAPGLGLDRLQRAVPYH
jgi:hypothetical protein